MLSHLRPFPSLFHVRIFTEFDLKCQIKFCWILCCLSNIRARGIFLKVSSMSKSIHTNAFTHARTHMQINMFWNWKQLNEYDSADWVPNKVVSVCHSHMLRELKSKQLNIVKEGEKKQRVGMSRIEQQKTHSQIRNETNKKVKRQPHKWNSAASALKTKPFPVHDREKTQKNGASIKQVRMAKKTAIFVCLVPMPRIYFWR